MSFEQVQDTPPQTGEVGQLHSSPSASQIASCVGGFWGQTAEDGARESASDPASTDADNVYVEDQASDLLQVPKAGGPATVLQAQILLLSTTPGVQQPLVTWQDALFVQPVYGAMERFPLTPGAAATPIGGIDGQTGEALSLAADANGAYGAFLMGSADAVRLAVARLPVGDETVMAEACTPAASILAQYDTVAIALSPSYVYVLAIDDLSSSQYAILRASR